MSKEQNKTAGIIIIGDEILSGRTLDRNSNHIARHLAQIGIELREVRVIADRENVIVETLNALRAQYSYVFTTGGIGPTHDDITADAVARAFDTGIDVDKRAVAMMRRRYSDKQLQGDRLRMARIPHGAELIDNPVSQAPGFRLQNVIVMAGVPAVMHAMLEAVTPDLDTGRPLSNLTLHVDAPESRISDLLRGIQERHRGVSIGSYPFFENQRFGAHLVLRSSDDSQLQDARRDLVTALLEQGLQAEEISES